tara:strand:- start:781 stop:1101 length:321 start_codon:yes stop_codon:yes gene_type:complete
MNEEDIDRRCPVTNRADVIDDCYIEIQFGYGSDKDMWTYKFDAVHDIVGKTVLESIQSLMDKGRSVEEFGEDTLAGCEAKMEEEWNSMTPDEQEVKKREWFGLPPY